MSRVLILSILLAFGTPAIAKVQQSSVRLPPQLRRKYNDLIFHIFWRTPSTFDQSEVASFVEKVPKLQAAYRNGFDRSMPMRPMVCVDATGSGINPDPKAPTDLCLDWNGSDTLLSYAPSRYNSVVSKRAAILVYSGALNKMDGDYVVSPGRAAALDSIFPFLRQVFSFARNASSVMSNEETGTSLAVSGARFGSRLTLSDNLPLQVSEK